MNELSPRNFRALTSVEPRSSNGHEFPSSRYFQTHFEYIEDTLALIRQDLALLNNKLGRLDGSERHEAGLMDPVPQTFKLYKDG